MNEQLSDKILERIDADKITSIPRWRILLLRGAFWLLALLSIVVGSLAVGTILFLFVDFGRHGLLSNSHDFNEILIMIPYLWVLLFVLFILLAWIGIEHTKKGYRHSLLTIISVSVMLSVIFGIALNFVGIGRATHELLEEVPFYKDVTFDSRAAWSRPVVGKLAGVVMSIKDNNNFSITDFGGHIWRVRLGTTTKGLFIPEASSTVRMVGLLESSSSTFIVNSIHEWEE